MPGTPPPAAGERPSLLEFLAFQQNAFFAAAYGLTDEQARSTPSASSLSIGGLVKHAAAVQKGWVQRAAWRRTSRRRTTARWPTSSANPSTVQQCTS
jgi:hypothetical protein